MFDDAFFERNQTEELHVVAMRASELALRSLKDIEDIEEFIILIDILVPRLDFIHAQHAKNVKEELTDLGPPILEDEGAVTQRARKIIQDYHRYLQTMQDRERKSKIQRNLRDRFNLYLSDSFAYEFSQGDLERIQTLVNELRDYISQCEELEEEHRQRLLKRLENLQSELHKKVSDLDRFWGLVGDAGVVMGKLGKDAKPIVDRIKEIAKITWNTQSRAEELPSDTQNPMIEHHQEN